MLGGTGFVGRAVAEDAVRRGWEVTVFHRGRGGVPEGVAHVRLGDREGDLAELAAGEWDAVVDTWSAAPGAVAASARALQGRVGRYAYVSSRSVYAYPAPAGADEDAPVVEGGDGDYAQHKRGGELAAVAAYGDAALLVRAGLILGPYEDVGRLPWWLHRVARGGRVLAPGPRDLPLQYIDARDLAGWTLDAVAAGLGGPYNLVSPPGHTTMGALLGACADVTGGDAEFVWAEPEAVVSAGVEPWTDLPVWLPPGVMHDAMHCSNVGRAVRAGLTCRDVTETVADTWSWLRSLPGPPPQRPDRPALGLDPAVERRVLASLA
ncbi:Nucleoside-diphosphate-sugar epimerase [Actinacidiphila paucisporea]|uniref:Nucleoside-diphosphate-sugar epimerase n=2 Tax=Actinacidiphila paucisporea TaxID=310782 RepID=A0A1M7HTA2_9ACTN|nr:Nucleoside-diphosphate-sugar epimerase [Actinacidiphila paucisporea]